MFLIPTLLLRGGVFLVLVIFDLVLRGLAGEESEPLPKFGELVVELVIDFEHGVVVANGPLRLI